MTTFVFGAAKGAPGVTTTVLALAAQWTRLREPMVIEADPAGGDLAAWLAPPTDSGPGIRETPSLVQVAAASRSGLSRLEVLQNLQHLPGPGRVRALVAPASPFAASTALRSLTAAGLGALLASSSEFDLLVDIGRVDATSPVLDAVAIVGEVTLVVRSTVSGVLHTRELARSLTAIGVRSSVLVIGGRPYGPVEVAEAIGAPIIGVLPEDPVGARAVNGEATSPRSFTRSRLLRAAGDLAAAIAPPPDHPELLALSANTKRVPRVQAASPSTGSGTDR